MIKEFIMENANILTLAVTGVTLLGLVFNLIKEWKNDDKLSKEHRDLTDKLSKEHSCLSKEHDNLLFSIQNKINDKSDILNNKSDMLKEQQSRIENSVSYIEKQIYATERSRAELSNKELDIVKTAEHINSLVSMLADMKSENMALKNECETLKRENAELRDRIYNLELYEDMEL